MAVFRSSTLGRTLCSGLVLAALALAGCQSPPPPLPVSSAPAARAPDLRVPVGVQVGEFSVARQAPAGLALAPDGALFVAEQAGPDEGSIVRLADSDGDGHADVAETAAANLPAPRGIAWWAPPGQAPILLAATSAGLMAVDSGQGRLVGRLGDGAGRANDVAVGTDGMVYVTQGADGAPRPGAVWRFDPAALLAADAPVQGELFVTGLRSADGIAFSPSGAIYVTDNGQGWPVQAGVPDELNVLLGGGDYGWPRVWGQPPPGSGSIGPMALFPAGSDAGSLLFYSGRMFDEYAADLLVALPGVGKVAQVEIVSDAAGYSSTVNDVIAGLKRPTALVEGRQGELYVADAATGVIYRLWR